jgi:glycosyltransferase involved in cell wall biosynthesis
MKLCIILPPGYFPYPLVSGGSQAVFNMIDNLRHDIKIALVFTYKKSEIKYVEQLKNIWNDVEFFGFKKSLFNYKKYPVEILRVLTNKIFKKSVFDSENSDIAYIDFFCKILEENDFDIAQTEFYPATNYVYAIKPQLKKIFVQHEICYIRNERLASRKISYYERYLMQKNKQEEITAMNMYDAVITLTNIDKGVLQRDGVKVPIYSSPALVNSQNNYKENYEFKNKVTFLASGSHLPNAEGLIWFIENIWNLAQKEYPNVQFNVIGNWDKKLYSKYSNVNFLGFIENLEQALDGAIMAVPLLAGSGMRIKIIDAINYGCPVITTSIGMEGLDFKNEIDCIIEDDAKIFAKKLCDLIKDEAKQRTLRKSAKNTMDKNYSKEILLEKRLNVYREFI